MIITLVGENDYERRQARDALVAAARQQYGADAVIFVDGEQADEQTVRQKVSAPSLLTPALTVVLSGASKNKPLSEALLNLLPEVPEANTLIINEVSLDKRTALYKTLKKTTDFREFTPRDARSLAQWGSKEAENRGGVMSVALAGALVERVGSDQWQLSQEIDKLLAYHPTVTVEAIEKLVSPNLQASAFTLLDAALGGRRDETAQLLAALRLRSDPYELFGLLVWQLHALALLATAPQGLSGSELAAQTGLKPFVLQKSQGLARRFGAVGVKQLVSDLADLDIRLKTSGIDPWTLVEQALMGIATQKDRT